MQENIWNLSTRCSFAFLPIASWWKCAGRRGRRKTCITDTKYQIYAFWYTRRGFLRVYDLITACLLLSSSPHIVKALTFKIRKIKCFGFQKLLDSSLAAVEQLNVSTPLEHAFIIFNDSPTLAFAFALRWTQTHPQLL